MTFIEGFILKIETVSKVVKVRVIEHFGKLSVPLVEMSMSLIISIRFDRLGC